MANLTEISKDHLCAIIAVLMGKLNVGRISVTDEDLQTLKDTCLIGDFYRTKDGLNTIDLELEFKPKTQVISPKGIGSKEKFGKI